HHERTDESVSIRLPSSPHGIYGHNGAVSLLCCVATSAVRRSPAANDSVGLVFPGGAFVRGLVWFRRDLRIHDNPALSAACRECREIVPLFVFDEPLLQSHVFGSACVGFMLGCLDDLRRSLAERGVSLLWRMGEPVETVLRSEEHTSELQ